jgi:EAL domain-containing protein (putative c-di-GMP-specific phosphodiesterase class I)
MFPFDKIKIDRTLILNMTKSSGCAAVIATAITLGRCLNIGTTAVGVVSKQECESLRVSGINFVQGYLFGPPCPASDLHLDGFYNHEFIDGNNRLAAAQ